jgi:predicted enzyme related to lactoylglutathione lyase
MSVTFFSVSLDCADAAHLADFWAQVLDRPIDGGATQDYASIGLESAGGGGPAWGFHRVPEAKAAKNRVHVDFLAADLEGEVKRLLALGATHLGDVEEGGYRWATVADPEGNEFDVIAAPQ